MVDEGRPRGIFSSSDRKFLELGEETYEEQHTRQSAHKRKEAIPERVRAALLDFEYLADPDRFPDEFLREVRELRSAKGEAVTEDLIRWGGEATEEPVLDPDIENGLVEMVAFAFRVKPNPGYFERLVRAGLQRVLDRVRPDAEVTDVSVSVSDPETIAAQIEQCIENGIGLTETELRVALEEDVRPPDEIAAHVREHGTRRAGVSPETVQTYKRKLQDL